MTRHLTVTFAGLAVATMGCLLHLYPLTVAGTALALLGMHRVITAPAPASVDEPDPFLAALTPTDWELLGNPSWRPRRSYVTRYGGPR